MHSREDEAYVVCRDGNVEDVIKDIAISLGRIADMLSEKNGYIVDYDASHGTDINGKQTKPEPSSFCEQNNCPWYDGNVCNSPHDKHGGECDYDWADQCQQCGKLIAIGTDEFGECPYCGAMLGGETNEIN